MLLVEGADQREDAAGHGGARGGDVACHGPPSRHFRSVEVMASAPGRTRRTLLRMSPADMVTQAAMDDEIATISKGVQARRRRGDAAAPGLPAVPQQPAAPPDQGPAPRGPGGRRGVGGRRRSGIATSVRWRRTSPSSTEASRSASGWWSPAACWTATGGRYGVSSSRSGRPTRAVATSTSVTSTPRRSTPLHRRRPLPRRRRRHLSVHRSSPGPTRGRATATPGDRRIHFSLFGTEFTQRMVTQMYFPGDPLFALDPIYQSIVDPQAAISWWRPGPRRHPARVVHGFSLGHRADQQPPHPDGGAHEPRPGDLTPTAGQTVGPFFHYALPYPGDSELVPQPRTRSVPRPGRRRGRRASSRR